MTTQELAYTEIQRLGTNFRNMPAACVPEDGLDRARDLDKAIANLDRMID
jgi:hypothetical protein